MRLGVFRIYGWWLQTPIIAWGWLIGGFWKGLSKKKKKRSQVGDIKKQKQTKKNMAMCCVLD